jgi:HicB_like antitoxin of bacterial toxin-antitoxin system
MQSRARPRPSICIWRAWQKRAARCRWPWPGTDFVDGIWAAVDVGVARFEGKAERINITLPRRLLARIDDYARAQGVTRSAFLAEEAWRAMH